MRSLFPKYPQLRALEECPLFLSGRLEGAYGIVWNDDLYIEVAEPATQQVFLVL